VTSPSSTHTARSAATLPVTSLTRAAPARRTTARAVSTTAAMTATVSLAGSGGSGSTTRTSLTISRKNVGSRRSAEAAVSSPAGSKGRAETRSSASRRASARAVVGAACAAMTSACSRAGASTRDSASRCARRSQSWRTRSRVMPPSSRPVVSSVVPPRPSHPQCRTASRAVRPGSARSAISASSVSRGRSDSSTATPLHAACSRGYTRPPRRSAVAGSGAVAREDRPPDVTGRSGAGGTGPWGDRHRRRGPPRSGPPGL
jgi:hypothetical protein